MKRPCVWHLLHTVLPDPYALAQAIMCEWQLSFLTCKWRGCWNQHSAVTRWKAVFLYFMYGFTICRFHPYDKTNNKWLDLLYDFMFKMFDSWTSFQCSRQGNFLIQSRCVFMDLKNTCNRVPRGILWEVCRTRDRQPCPPTEHGQNNGNNLQYNAIQYSNTINNGHKISISFWHGLNTKWKLLLATVLYHIIILCYCVHPLCVILMYLNILKPSFRLSTLNVKPVYQLTVRCPSAYTISQMLWARSYKHNTLVSFGYFIWIDLNSSRMCSGWHSEKTPQWIIIVLSEANFNFVRFAKQLYGEFHSSIRYFTHPKKKKERFRKRGT